MYAMQSLGAPSHDRESLVWKMLQAKSLVVYIMPSCLKCASQPPLLLRSTLPNTSDLGPSDTKLCMYKYSLKSLLEP